MVLRRGECAYGVVRCIAAAIVAICLAVLPRVVAADDTPSGGSRQIETWVGAEANSNAAALYGGMAWAPFGDVRADGLRLRAGGGRGWYRYNSGAARIVGEATFSEWLAGYQANLGTLTVKAFAGVATDAHALVPADLDNSLAGGATGAKVVLETWINLAPKLWSAIDLAWTQAHSTYAGRARLGWRVGDNVSVGVEAASFGNVESDGGRGGGFVRLEWQDGEVSLTGGVTGNIRAPDTPYGQVNLTTRF